MYTSYAHKRARISKARRFLVFILLRIVVNLVIHNALLRPKFRDVDRLID